MSIEQVDAQLRLPVDVPSQVSAAVDAPVVPLRPHAPGRYERYAKRTADLLIAGTALVVLSPLIALTALAVRLRLGSPVLYRQQRIGRGGEAFAVLKFRTMAHDRRGDEPRHAWSGDDRRRTHKSDHDPRHTDLGRFLRRTSLDELPQLWNVLRGDMSVVGPRPELASVVLTLRPLAARPPRRAARAHRPVAGLRPRRPADARGDAHRPRVRRAAVVAHRRRGSCCRRRRPSCSSAPAA